MPEPDGEAKLLPRLPLPPVCWSAMTTVPDTAPFEVVQASLLTPLEAKRTKMEYF